MFSFRSFPFHDDTIIYSLFKRNNNRLSLLLSSSSSPCLPSSTYSVSHSLNKTQKYIGYASQPFSSFPTSSTALHPSISKTNFETKLSSLLSALSSSSISNSTINTNYIEEIQDFASLNSQFFHLELEPYQSNFESLLTKYLNQYYQLLSLTLTKQNKEWNDFHFDEQTNQILEIKMNQLLLLIISKHQQLSSPFPFSISFFHSCFALFPFVNQSFISVVHSLLFMSNVNIYFPEIFLSTPNLPSSPASLSTKDFRHYLRHETDYIKLLELRCSIFNRINSSSSLSSSSLSFLSNSFRFLISSISSFFLDQIKDNFELLIKQSSSSSSISPSTSFSLHSAIPMLKTMLVLIKSSTQSPSSSSPSTSFIVHSQLSKILNLIIDSLSFDLDSLLVSSPYLSSTFIEFCALFSEISFEISDFSILQQKLLPLLLQCCSDEKKIVSIPFDMPEYQIYEIQRYEFLLSCLQNCSSSLGKSYIVMNLEDQFYDIWFTLNGLYQSIQKEYIKSLKRSPVNKSIVELTCSNPFLLPIVIDPSIYSHFLSSLIKVEKNQEQDRNERLYYRRHFILKQLSRWCILYQQSLHRPSPQPFSGLPTRPTQVPSPYLTTNFLSLRLKLLRYQLRGDLNLPSEILEYLSWFDRTEFLSSTALVSSCMNTCVNGLLLSAEDLEHVLLIASTANLTQLRAILSCHMTQPPHSIDQFDQSLPWFLQVFQSISSSVEKSTLFWNYFVVVATKVGFLQPHENTFRVILGDISISSIDCFLRIISDFAIPSLAHADVSIKAENQERRHHIVSHLKSTYAAVVSNYL